MFGLLPSRAVARSSGAVSAMVSPLPWLSAVAPADAAEGLRGDPGLILLESARPGRQARWSYLAADPLEILERSDPGPDPFAGARRLLARMAADPAPAPARGELGPPFRGGLAGYLAYDLGRRLERIPSLAAADQPLPDLRLGLYDQLVAWDGRSGSAWLVSRTVDGDVDRMWARRETLLARLVRAQGAPGPRRERVLAPSLRFRSNLDRPTYLARIARVKAAIAAGELYQANLARRLEAPFAGDPWAVYRRLRLGEPAGFNAFIDLDAGRAIASASPEPFLRLRSDGVVASDPIKGTRPRGRTRALDRAFGRLLLSSAKDRAENTMIVDVLRNDLGRACAPGTVRVPRLCRLERTASVQHLVSTVVGRLLPDLDAFHLLAAAFPGGSVTGAPKIQAMELIDALEPVRRGPYTGAALWIGADGQLSSSILIRTFVADGKRLTLHVGGGITWRSDPAAEWEETRVKARGPLTAIGAGERAAGGRPPRW